MNFKSSFSKLMHLFQSKLQFTFRYKHSDDFGFEQGGPTGWYWVSGQNHSKLKVHSFLNSWAKITRNGLDSDPIDVSIFVEANFNFQLLPDQPLV